MSGNKDKPKYEVGDTVYEVNRRGLMKTVGAIGVGSAAGIGALNSSTEDVAAAEIDTFTFNDPPANDDGDGDAITYADGELDALTTTVEDFSVYYFNFGSDLEDADFRAAVYADEFRHWEDEEVDVEGDPDTEIPLDEQIIFENQQLDDTDDELPSDDLGPEGEEDNQVIAGETGDILEDDALDPEDFDVPDGEINYFEVDVMVELEVFDDEDPDGDPVGTIDTATRVGTLAFEVENAEAGATSDGELDSDSDGDDAE